MQQLELFPELTTAEPYIGVEFTDGEDVYVSSPAIEFIEGVAYGFGATCKGCAFEWDDTCYHAPDVVDCSHHPIIWVKKG